MYIQMLGWENRLGELAFLMKQDHRERADVMSNNLLWSSWRKMREKVEGIYAEVRGICGLRRNLQIILIKSRTSNKVHKTNYLRLFYKPQPFHKVLGIISSIVHREEAGTQVCLKSPPPLQRSQSLYESV